MNKETKQQKKSYIKKKKARNISNTQHFQTKFSHSQILVKVPISCKYFSTISWH